MGSTSNQHPAPTATSTHWGWKVSPLICVLFSAICHTWCRTWTVGKAELIATNEQEWRQRVIQLGNDNNLLNETVDNLDNNYEKMSKKIQLQQERLLSLVVEKTAIALQEV